MPTKSIKLLLSFSLLPCVILGGIIGFFMGEDAQIFAPIGNIFINAVFTLVVPLIGTSIICAITSMKDTKRLGKVFKISLCVFFITSLFSSLVMTIIVAFIPAAQKMDLPFAAKIAEQSRSLADIIVSILSVPDFVNIFSRSNMLPMLIFSIGIGLATLSVGSAGEKFAQLVESANTVLIRLNKIIMMAAPIGLGAYFATLTGRFGTDIIGHYVSAASIYWGSGILYIAIIFTFYAWLSGGLETCRRFWGAISPTAITAISTCSSAASLPTNLQSAKKIGVPTDIANICIPLGTNIHKQGAARCGVLFAAFLFCIFGAPIDTPQIFFTLLCLGLLISIIMGAIPNGGMIVEVVIINILGYPLEALPLLAVLHTLVDPLSTVINACGNTVNSMVISRLMDGKKWWQ